MPLFRKKVAPAEKVREEERVELKKGYSYLVKESEPVKSYELFKNELLKNSKGLCFSRNHPEKIKQRYGLENVELYWLSHAHEDKGQIDPTNLVRIMIILREFLKGIGDKVVLIDGIEYLIFRNGFTALLRFIQSLNEHIVLSDSILIVPINPRTLNGKELALLGLEMEIVEAVY